MMRTLRSSHRAPPRLQPYYLSVSDPLIHTLDCTDPSTVVGESFATFAAQSGGLAIVLSGLNSGCTKSPTELLMTKWHHMRTRPCELECLPTPCINSDTTKIWVASMRVDRSGNTWQNPSGSVRCATTPCQNTSLNAGLVAS